MNTYKLIAVGTAALGMAYGQTATAGELASGAVSGATNLAKGAASSTLSGAKSLLSMPGKALSFGNDALPDLSAGTQEFGLSGNVSFGDDIISILNLSGFLTSEHLLVLLASAQTAAEALLTTFHHSPSLVSSVLSTSFVRTSLS